MSSDDLVAALDSILLRYVNLPFGQAEGIECRDAILIALAAKPEPGPHHPERAAKPELPPADGKPGGWDYPGHFDPMTGKDRDR